MGKCISRESENELIKKRSLTKEDEIDDKSCDLRDTTGGNLLQVKSSIRKIVKNSLKKHYLFKQLKKHDMMIIFEKMISTEYLNDEVIYEQGALGNKFYVISSGIVKVIRDGIISDKLTKGGTFGEMALVTSSKRKETVETISKTAVWSLSRGCFKQALKIIFSKNFDSHREFISKIKFFANAADSQKDALTRLSVVHEYKENDVIIKENDDAELMFILIEGKISLQKSNSEPLILDSGSTFGEVALLTGSKIRFTAVSSENSKLLSLDKAALISVFGENFRDTILKNIAKYSILHDSFLEFLSKEHIIMIVESLVWNQYPPGEVILPLGYDKQSRFLAICTGDVVSISNSQVFKSGMVIGLKNENERKLLNEEYIAGNDTVVGEINAESVESMLNIKIDELYQEAESIKVLKSISIFKYLPLHKLKTLSSKMYVEEFEKKEIIFNAKDPADNLYIVIDGSVEIYNEGKVLRTLGKDDFFGERCLSEETRSASARALTRTDCWVIYADDLRAIMDETINIELERKKYYQADMMLNNLMFVQVWDEKSERRVYMTYYEKHKAFYDVEVISKARYSTQEQCLKLVQEKQINLKLDYYLIVKLVKTFTDYHNVYFVTEHIGGITLKEYMKTHINENTCRFLTACLVSILEYLHDKDIVYRDLCPENIQVNNQGYPHLYNFSASKIVKGRTYTNIGNIYYKSPEIFTGRGYSKSTDYWSLGVLLYEMLYGTLPFGINPTDDPVTVYEKIINNSLSFSATHVYVLANELIEKLLQNDTKRTQGESIRKSPWMGKISWDRLARPNTISFVGPKIPPIRTNSLKENKIKTLERYLNENFPEESRQKIFRSNSLLSFKWDKYF
ncbi:hypothetical protein SteCoe_30529 [Stentor coeruleus]|uniref:cGMP-dependent protein kinase n=1 Tax=Stentor coeruleus TaxID=5963 RepID=A0A1R2B3V4_9CILI|nr:hypothetical protein SteCoe_30529 [Stentor coeruleus]